jgi:hypothetical protein
MIIDVQCRLAHSSDARLARPRTGAASRRRVLPFGRRDIVGEFLQGGAQPSLGLPLLLVLALVGIPNPSHFRNERFDDPVDFLLNEHDTMLELIL